MDIQTAIYALTGVLLIVGIIGCIGVSVNIFKDKEDNND